MNWTVQGSGGSIQQFTGDTLTTALACDNAPYAVTATLTNDCGQQCSATVTVPASAFDEFEQTQIRSVSQGTFLDRIEVEWFPVSGVDAYRIYRSTDAVGPFGLVGEVDSDVNSFVDTNLPAGQTFHYKVSMKNCSGSESSLSPAQSGSTAAAP